MKTLVFQNMKKGYYFQFGIFALALCFISIESVIGQATLPHYDGLNYTVGQGLQSQSGWTTLNSGDDLAITSGSLTHPLGTQTGNKVAFAGSGIDAAKLITQQTSGTVYFGFMLNVAALGSLNTTGGYFAGFTEGAGTTFGATVWTRSDGSGYDIGINPRTTAANTVWSTGTQSVGTTLLIVIGYEMVAGATNDIVSLWINPDPNSTTPPTPTLTATNTLADLANVNRIFLRQDGNTATPSIEMDEFRIGTAWVNALPITLKSLTATPRNKTTQINFTTATETNNAYFNIERSADGVKFENIGRVQGNGTTAQEHNYSFTDETPLAGINYYRLHQVDFDGQSSYSKVVSVRFGKSGQVYNVYPNPATDVLKVEATEAVEGVLNIEIYNQAGALVKQMQYDGETTLNEVPVADLPAGNYIVKMMSGAEVTVEKFSKQ